MSDQLKENTHPNIQKQPLFDIYKNRKSKLHESILLQHSPTRGTYSLHIFALVLTPQKYRSMKKRVIDLRLSSKKHHSPNKLLMKLKRGSLSFSRIFVKNVAEKEYEQKLLEKYPTKRKIPKQRYFPPQLLLFAHYCDQFEYPVPQSKEKQEEQIQEQLKEFDEFIQIEIHPILSTLGKMLYLKGKTGLVKFHQTREFPEKLVERLSDEKLLESATKVKSFTTLEPLNLGIRRDYSKQHVWLRKQPDPNAITHIFTKSNDLLPIFKERFPLIVVGEQEVRRNLILNLLKNANGQFLILDPQEEYGKIAMVNPRVRGYRLGENYLLNISGTDGGKIKQQVYAFWFAQIIAFVNKLRPELTKTLETYLLGAYRSPLNRLGSDVKFTDLASQDVTAEVAKMTRNDTALIPNLFYPISTYEELSIMTKIGGSFSFDVLFETKGGIIQFSKTDQQLTKLAYLFTILKLRSLEKEGELIVVLENLDDFIGKDASNWQTTEISNLVLGLPENCRIIIGARSPARIQKLFKQSKTKLINRILSSNDQRLLEKEFNIYNSDISQLNALTDKEFYLLLPEFVEPKTIQISQEPNTKMGITTDELEQESAQLMIHASDRLREEALPPEIKKGIFELLKVLREKGSNMMPEQYLDETIINCPKETFLRAKEVAKQQAFVKTIKHVDDSDSKQTITYLKLTEIGEEYYLKYLKLQEKIPVISIKTLAAERDFERIVLSLFEAARGHVEQERFEQAIGLMQRITVKLLAILPEEERFVRDTGASKIFEYWSYLTFLKDHEITREVRSFIDEFHQAVMNVLKQLKSELLVKEQERQALDTSTEESDELEFSLREEPEDPFIEEEPFDLFEEFKLVDVEEFDEEEDFGSGAEDITDKNSSSHFLAATEELNSAGMIELDPEGNAVRPKDKQKIGEKQQSREGKNGQRAENVRDPFAPLDERETREESELEQEKMEIIEIRNALLEEIAEILGCSIAGKEHYLWTTLTSRFKGVIDDGYTISEVVSTIQQMFEDINSGGLILEERKKQLIKKITSEKLLPPALINDLKRYLQDSEF
ncbi:MAG: hypothetical protein GF308_20645 [Candidatus Heimdallarchaeota archaeon]|nr:hypothetical protein [Candidatus Heimdallarchaeota archaeon]